jgi:hypothetical protein
VPLNYTLKAVSNHNITITQHLLSGGQCSSVPSCFHTVMTTYMGCPESIRPFWISREPVACPLRHLAASRRRPYCASVESLSRRASQSAVRRCWLSLCTVRPSHSQCPIQQISFITTMRLPIIQLSSGLFWQSITSPRSVSPPTAQIWLPATSGFSQS